MTTSDIIYSFLNDMLKDLGGELLISRSEVASRFNCVPSQINYVIETRFAPELGYIVESRRGGGGYIRISRVDADSSSMIMHAVNSICDRLDGRSSVAILQNLVSCEVLDKKQAKLMLAAVSTQALRRIPQEDKDFIRADILKNMLVSIR